MSKAGDANKQKRKKDREGAEQTSSLLKKGVKPVSVSTETLTIIIYGVFPLIIETSRVRHAIPYEVIHLHTYHADR